MLIVLQRRTLKMAIFQRPAKYEKEEKKFHFHDFTRVPFFASEFQFVVYKETHCKWID